MSQILVTGEAKIRDIQGPVVANSGVITALDGAANQYVRGDGTLAIFPTSSGGGSSVSYYLNGSVNQGTFGGSTYYQMSRNAIVGTGTNFSTSANGLIAQFITDANDPDVVSIPSGNWNVEFFMSVSASSGALASFYVEIYKYNGSTFTLLATNVATPEQLTNTTTVDAYFTSVAMPLSAMAVTDRLAVRIFANVASKTVTLYTEDNRLCQIVTTFSNGLTSLNNLTDQSQYLAVGTSGTDFNIASSGDTHTFNIPSASLTNRGLVTTGSQTFAGAKTFENNLNINGQLFVFGSTGYGGGVSYRQGNILATSDGSTTLEFPDANSIKYYVGQGSNTYKNFIFDVSNITTGATRTFTFPNATGTIALTSDISYPVTSVFGRTGAVVAASGDYTTTQVTEGTNLYFTDARARAALSATSPIFYNSTTGVISSQAASATLQGFVTTSSQTIAGVKTFSNGIVMDNGSSGVPLEFKQYASAGYSGTGFTSLFALNNSLCINFGNPSGFIILNTTTLTSNRTFTFQNASGTLALTSDLGAYLPLTGGTLTGALSGTSATFSGNIGINTSTPDIIGYNTKTFGILGVGSDFPNMQIGIPGTAAATTDVMGDINFFSKNGGGTVVSRSIIRSGLDGATNSNSFTFFTMNAGTLAARLTIASTGAATFSSSVTATGLSLTTSGSTGATFTSSGTNVYTSLSFFNTTTNYGYDIGFGGSASIAPNSFYIYGGSTSSVKLLINPTGNVGIGTSSPSYALHAQATSANVAYFNRTTTDGDVLTLAVGGTNAFIFNTTSGIRNIQALGLVDMAMWTNGSERMRITSDARVLIGKTTINIDAADGFRFDENGAMFASISSGNETYYVRDITNSVYRFYVTSGGTINATNTTISAISDVRLKENITDLEIGLDAIMALRPRKFDWKKESGNDGKNVRGFIAQEFEQVFPDLIDESLNKSPEGEAYKQIRQDLIPILVKAIQEQQAQIEELKAMIAAK